ncbi:hypothetical protein X797_000797 [Metarhizium robertsii]|uniref:Uncharacterized protein n=1 Tax=Metarhizium robertsii TaxID=568076 RepID=A0A0A1V899_9HYPO|nr:hypothetical protein X797_000797 [Metarhizium robertsii]
MPVRVRRPTAKGETPMWPKGVVVPGFGLEAEGYSAGLARRVCIMNKMANGKGGVCHQPSLMTVPSYQWRVGCRLICIICHDISGRRQHSPGWCRAKRASTPASPPWSLYDAVFHDITRSAEYRAACGRWSPPDQRFSVLSKVMRPPHQVRGPPVAKQGKQSLVAEQTVNAAGTQTLAIAYWRISFVTWSSWAVFCGCGLAVLVTGKKLK